MLDDMLRTSSAATFNQRPIDSTVNIPKDWEKASSKTFRMLPRSVFDLKSRATYLAVVVVLMILSIVYYLKCCSQWQSVDDRVSQAVVIDAGSTGSRLNLYTFIEKDGTQKELKKHVFLPIKPGLSSYASVPSQGAASLDALLKRANQEVPVWRRNRTPLALWATAGLRLLPSKQADDLLDSVRGKLHSTQYKVEENSVQIIDGEEEGFFAWMTINFLLDSLMSDPVGIIDLGGGSVQITFQPTDPESAFSGKASSFKKPITLFKQTSNLYVHSYLNLGLMAGRYRIMGGQPDDSDTKKLECGCLPEKYTDTWHYANRNILIKHGKSLPSSKDCSTKARGLVADLHKPKELADRRFILMSYFFDRASEMKLVDPEKGGFMEVGAFLDAAKKECASNDMKRPFMCMDLMFISTLLIDGFGFPPNKQVEVRNKINGVEANWALGAAFQLLS